MNFGFDVGPRFYLFVDPRALCQRDNSRAVRIPRNATPTPASHICMLDVQPTLLFLFLDPIVATVAIQAWPQFGASRAPSMHRRSRDWVVCYCILTSRRLYRRVVTAQRPSLVKVTNHVCRRQFRLSYDKTTDRPQFPKSHTEIPVSGTPAGVDTKTDGPSEDKLQNAFRALRPNKVAANRWHSELDHFNARLRTLARQLTASRQTRQRLDWLLRGKDYVSFRCPSIF
jgi:hypothetical protein